MASSAPVALSVEKPLTVSDVGASPNRFLFEPERGRLYLVKVDQQGLDVAISVKTLDGITSTLNTPVNEDGSEYMLLDETRSGTYQLDISAVNANERRGGYTIVVLPLGTGSLRDAREIEAWRLMSDAAVANADARSAQKRVALAAYLNAAELWEDLGKSRERAHALYCAAMLNYWNLGEWYVADRLADEAARLFASVQEIALEANSTLLRAMALTEAIDKTGDKEQLLATISTYLDDSYAAHETLGNTSQLAKVRYFNALSNLKAGNYEQAKRFYLEAANLFDEERDWNSIRFILLDNAVIDINLGNNGEAISQLKILLQKEQGKNPVPTTADSNFQATVLDQLAVAQGRIGEIDDALDNFSTAFDLHTVAGDLHGAAESLRGKAGIYLGVGDLLQSRRFLEQAEQAATRSDNGRVLGTVNTTLGNLAYAEGDYSSAIKHHKRSLQWSAKDSPVWAHRLVALAAAHIAAEEFDAALELAQQAKDHARRTDSPRAEADALFQIGKAEHGRSAFDQSIANLEQALDLYERMRIPDGQADVEHSLAVVLAEMAVRSSETDERTRWLDAAVSRSERSMNHVDGLLGKVSVPELRAHYAATRLGYFKFHIDLLMDKYAWSGKTDIGPVAAALATSERARARWTMDLLNEASVNLQQSVNSDVAAEMGLLVEQLGELQQRRDFILARGGVSGARYTELNALAEQFASIRNQIDLLQLELRRSNTHYQALTAPETADLARIQSLIDDDSVMLQYSLGENRSYVWVVGGESINAVQLADRGTINSAAERAIVVLRQSAGQSDARTDQGDALLEVSRLILNPVADLIGSRRLIVVADGALNYLPFQALPIESDNALVPLIETREVVALPSMTVLAALRDRKTEHRSDKTIAIFADPVFEVADPRLGGESRSEEQKTTLGHSARDYLFVTRSTLGDSLPRLIGTRDEARAISGLVSKDDQLVALGFEASRQKIMQPDIGRYRYLHIATHGEVDRQTPALSALVFSRFDEMGGRQEGYLRLQDIYQLDINAELVVLSACETGLGSDINGEGLIGLTQGFLYAGARSLVVSLWDVPDGPTAELMTRFYEQILRNGLRPSAALRHAQRSMAAERRWQDPYYWSAFVLLGDWK